MYSDSDIIAFLKNTETKNIEIISNLEKNHLEYLTTILEMDNSDMEDIRKIMICTVEFFQIWSKYDITSDLVSTCSHLTKKTLSFDDFVQLCRFIDLSNVIGKSITNIIPQICPSIPSMIISNTIEGGFQPIQKVRKNKESFVKRKQKTISDTVYPTLSQNDTVEVITAIIDLNPIAQPIVDNMPQMIEVFQQETYKGVKIIQSNIEQYLVNDESVEIAKDLTIAVAGTAIYQILRKGIKSRINRKRHR